MNKKPLIILGIILFTGVFYWFQWRPSEIKKDCAKKAQNYYISKFNSEDSMETQLDPNNDNAINDDGILPLWRIDRISEDKKTFYTQCLTGEGL